jgi:hypothetical protein
MSRVNHRGALESDLATLAGLSKKNREDVIDKTLELRKREVIQRDVLDSERKRRDRVVEKRIKSTLFSKSRELYHLEQLCRSVAGTLGQATCWQKFFVADPDFVLASNVKKVHRKAAKKRAAAVVSEKADIRHMRYSSFPQPDALHGAPKTKYQKQATAKAARAAANMRADAGDPEDDTESGDGNDIDDSSSTDGDDANPPVQPVPHVEQRVAEPAMTKEQRARRRWATGHGGLSDMYKHNETERSSGRNRIGQAAPKDERWPAWNTPDPEVPTNADYGSLLDDAQYFQEFGMYLSDVMFAATKATVAEIRVLDTLVSHGKRIPIRRLVCEALVSTMFAKWIASNIIMNRILSCGIWPKDIVAQNLAYQLETCRAFFMNPDTFSGSSRIYDEVPEAPQNAMNYYYNDENDEDEDDGGDE